MPGKAEIIVNGGKFSEFSQQGNQSIVYVNEEENRLCKVAKDDSPISQQKIIREAQTLQKIGDAGGHAGIISVLEMAVTDKLRLPAFVMPFVAGKQIMEALESARTNAIFRTAFLSLLEAFVFLHEKMKLIHVDPSTQNILLKENGQVVVIDFDAAVQVPAAESGVQTASSTTCRGPVTITPEEIALGEGMTVELRYDQDIYGLAAVAVCCAAGKIIYQAEEDNYLRVMPREFHGMPISTQCMIAMFEVRSVLKFPPELDQVTGMIQPLLKKAMSHDPKERPSAREFRDKLSDLPGDQLFFDEAERARREAREAARVRQLAQEREANRLCQEASAYDDPWFGM